jgi:hypothetical protein
MIGDLLSREDRPESLAEEDARRALYGNRHRRPNHPAVVDARSAGYSGDEINEGPDCSRLV